MSTCYYADFEAYVHAQNRVESRYKDTKGWQECA